ncbi:MAG: T9SS type A sorting domain-containing protein, partial [Bacteroidota bacterium]
FNVINTNDSGSGSLREAITESNFSSSADVIHFNIVGQAPHHIILNSALDYIHQPLTIDGSSQPANGFNGIAPKIELDGLNNSFNGLDFHYNFPYHQYSSAIYGLFIHNFMRGIATIGSGKFTCGDVNKRNVISGNYLGGRFENDSILLIENNFIGTDTSGSSAFPNHTGILVVGNQLNNTILNNVISGDTIGITVIAASAIIKGNLFGTDKSGSYAIPNIDRAIDSDVTEVTIGGSNAGEGNLISGNCPSGGIGILCHGNPVIKGNKFGTNLSGTDTIPNHGTAIYISTSNNFQIGGPSLSDRNIISSSEKGIYIDYGNNGVIQNNLIGTDISNTLSFGNYQEGISIVGSDSVKIFNNTVAGNGTGIYLLTSNHDSLLNNTIHSNSLNGIFNAGTANNNLFSINSIYDNGANGIKNNFYANDSILKPIIILCTPDSVLGTSLPGARIELYYSQSLNNTPQGKDYIATVTADLSGSWKYLGTITNVQKITATQTDNYNNTSEFAELLTVGINDIEISDKKLISPNPSSGKFTIQSPKEKISQITITNISGQAIFKKEFLSSPLAVRGSYEIDLTNQSKGIYLLQVIAGKEVYNQKIILD